MIVPHEDVYALIFVLKLTPMERTVNTIVHKKKEILKTVNVNTVNKRNVIIGTISQLWNTRAPILVTIMTRIGQMIKTKRNSIVYTSFTPNFNRICVEMTCNVTFIATKLFWLLQIFWSYFPLLSLLYDIINSLGGEELKKIVMVFSFVSVIILSACSSLSNDRLIKDYVKMHMELISL